MNNPMKISWFMTFHIKLWLVLKPLHIRFNKIDGFIRIYDGTRKVALFNPEKYNAIYNRIKYLFRQKSGIIYFLSLLQEN